MHAAYQPVIEIGTRRTVAFEALLRLEHAGRTVPPLAVFRAAADAGRIAAAEHAARIAAIRGAAGWIGRRSLVLNLLPHAIVSSDDVAGTDAAVAAARLERSQVVFEVAVPGDHGERHVVRVLEHLRMRGYGIALDDVTDAATSLDLVRRVQPDTLKVAPALVRELPGLHARAAVAAVLGAAHAAGSRVGVKGIETASHLEAVLLAGIDDAQGWQVGLPMRAPGDRPAFAS